MHDTETVVEHPWPIVTRRWRRSRRLFIPLVLVGALALGWWSGDLAAFEPYVGDSAYQFLDMPPGQPMHLDAGLSAHQGVWLQSLAPVLTDGSPPVAWAVHVCAPGPEGNIGATTGDLSRWCEAPESVVAGSPAVWLALPRRAILTVVALEPGTVRIEGVRIRYRRGMRQAEQHAGRAFTIPFVEGAQPL